MIGKSRYINSIQRVGGGVRSDIERYIEWFHEKHHEIFVKVLGAGCLPLQKQDIEFVSVSV